ncbi:MAG: peptidoglycan-binding protein LysM [Saprospiraceae bacterium]
MGVFSFLKNAGAKIFGSDNNEEAVKAAADKAAAAAAAESRAAEMLERQRGVLLRSVVDSTGIPIENLDLLVDRDAVTIHGQVMEQQHKEKLVLALGNVTGISTVDDRMTVVNPEPEADFYEVKSGDSLSKIAKKFYGNAMEYPAIFEANKPMLKDVDKIYPGQMLRIPKK